jgi:hypothetical protein
MTSATRARTRARLLAVTLAQHAARTLPGACSPWAAAMRRETDHIADDVEAVRWAIGCVLGSYRARLLRRRTVNARTAWRQIVASGALMLVIGFALLDNAGGQTPPPEPTLDKTACDAGPPPLPAECRSHCADRRPSEAPVAPDDLNKDAPCSSKSKMP